MTGILVIAGLLASPATRRSVVPWRFAWLEESINPKAATRLPLLFAIDQKLRLVRSPSSVQIGDIPRSRRLILRRPE